MERVRVWNCRPALRNDDNGAQRRNPRKILQANQCTSQAAKESEERDEREELNHGEDDAGRLALSDQPVLRL